MITEIELKNVRIFGEAGVKFSLPKLSVFCGTNSSGKSTILKSLLLLRQSQGIRESSNVLPGRLRFVGSKVDLGSYASFVFHRETHRDISITVTIEGEMPHDSVSFLRSLHTPDRAESALIKNGSPSVSYLLRSCFTFTGASHKPSAFHPSVALEMAEDENVALSTPQGILKSTHYEIIVDGETLLSWKVKISKETENSEPEYEILIPQNYSKKDVWLKMMGLEHAEDEKFLKATAVLNGILPDKIVSKTHLSEMDEKPETTSQWSFFLLPPHIQKAMEDLRKTLDRIHYLGPLRTPAKRYYVTALDAPPGFDPAGEFLPYVLRYKDKYEVWNVPPGQHDKAKEDLLMALNGWLYYLRAGKEPPSDVCDEIALSTKSVLMEFALKTVGGTESYALADSGFGYSQVLPILVRGLLARPGSTFIIEQPELHLNPALQVRLADFLVAMTRAGKQVIIETHSEHIVNAIRALTAEDESGELSSNCAIFFIDAEKDVPVIHELSIKPDGTVPDWPYNFFGEAAYLTGRLLRAQKRFRKQAKKSQE